MNLIENMNIAGDRKSQSNENIVRIPDNKEKEKTPPKKRNHPAFLFFIE
jgi:hypothetical protein